MADVPTRQSSRPIVERVEPGRPRRNPSWAVAAAEYWRPDREGSRSSPHHGDRFSAQDDAHGRPIGSARWGAGKGFCNDLVFVLVDDETGLCRHQGRDPIPTRPVEERAQRSHQGDGIDGGVLQPRQTPGVAMCSVSTPAEPRRNGQSFVEKSQQTIELLLIGALEDLGARQSTGGLDDPRGIATGRVPFVDHEPEIPRRSHVDTNPIFDRLIRLHPTGRRRPGLIHSSTLSSPSDDEPRRSRIIW
jgi:hypothetical protein